MTEPREETSATPRPFGRFVAGLFIVCYFGLTAWFLARAALGLSGGQPLAYFFTWDMFPNYETESVRRVVVVEDGTGRAWRLLPSPRDRFRWGNHGDASRFDLDRRLPPLFQAIESEAPAFVGVAPVRAAPRDRPLRLRVFERYQPFGRQAGRPVSLDDAGAVSPTHYWRPLAEGDVDTNGTVKWTARP